MPSYRILLFEASKFFCNLWSDDINEMMLNYVYNPLSVIHTVRTNLLILLLLVEANIVDVLRHQNCPNTVPLVIDPYVSDSLSATGVLKSGIDFVTD